jgi:hypothetical protein
MRKLPDMTVAVVEAFVNTSSKENGFIESEYIQVLNHGNNDIRGFIQKLSKVGWLSTHFYVIDPLVYFGPFCGHFSCTVLQKIIQGFPKKSWLIYEMELTLKYKVKHFDSFFYGNQLTTTNQLNLISQ